jgi:hypothetical protein
VLTFWSGAVRYVSSIAVEHPHPQHRAPTAGVPHPFRVVAGRAHAHSQPDAPQRHRNGTVEHREPGSPPISGWVCWFAMMWVVLHAPVGR